MTSLLSLIRDRVLANLGYPLSRWLQKRFAEGSKMAMVEAAGGK